MDDTAFDAHLYLPPERTPDVARHSVVPPTNELDAFAF
jgi:hypothetical protein